MGGTKFELDCLHLEIYNVWFQQLRKPTGALYSEEPNASLLNLQEKPVSMRFPDRDIHIH